jgi:hypothetical protein
MSVESFYEGQAFLYDLVKILSSSTKLGALTRSELFLVTPGGASPSPTMWR